jgi:hypothetical protein
MQHTHVLQCTNTHTMPCHVLCYAMLCCAPQITERYPIDGSEVKNNRRDMRGGEGA